MLLYVEEEMRVLREARREEIDSLNEQLRGVYNAFKCLRFHLFHPLAMSYLNTTQSIDAKCAQEVNSYAKKVVDEKLKAQEEV